MKSKSQPPKHPQIVVTDETDKKTKRRDAVVTQELIQVRANSRASNHDHEPKLAVAQKPEDIVASEIEQKKKLDVNITQGFLKIRSTSARSSARSSRSGASPR